MSGAAAFFPDAVTPGVPAEPPSQTTTTSNANNKEQSNSRVRPPPSSNPDDWLCQQCNNINFARRMKCNRCQADKPFTANASNKLPPGVLSAEVIAKSNGKYHEGDWSCSKCANVNWARRQSCNTCSAKKPGTGVDEGPREGRGGGFLEREERVAYKDTRYKEDESKYDDMGRLKKQFRVSAQNAQTSQSSTDGNSKEEKSETPHAFESDGAARKNRSSRSRSRDRERDRDYSPRHRSYRRSRSRSRSRSPYDRRRYSDRPRRRSWSRSRSPPPRRRPYSPRRSSRSPPPRSRNNRSSRSRSRSNSRGRRDRDRSRSRSRGRDRSPPPRRRSRSRSRDRR